MSIGTTPLNEVDYTASGSSTTHTINYAIVAGTDRATIVRVTIPNASTSAVVESVVLDPEGLNVALVKQTEKDGDVPGHPIAYIYTLPEDDHPTAGTYPIVLTIALTRRIVANVQTWGGVDQSGLDTAGGLAPPTPTSGTGATPSISVSGATGGLVLDCLSIYSTSSITATPDDGQTLDHHAEITQFGSGFSHADGDTSVAMGWTLTDRSNWALVAIALLPAETNTAPTVEIAEKTSIGSTIYLPVGATLQLNATITDPDAADADLTAEWNSDDTDVATVGTDGLVTAVAEGSSVVTASTTDAAEATGSDSVTIVVDNTPGAGTTLILGDDMIQQEVLQVGEDGVVKVALLDASGDLLTSNPLEAGDITISINDGTPTTLAGDDGLASLALVNGLLPIPIDATELPSAGDRVSLLIKDRDGTSYRTKFVEILVFNGNPAVGVTVPTNFSSLAITSGGAVTAGTVADSSGVTSLLDRLTSTRAGNLDKLDAAISTLLTSADYTAPDNDGITALGTTLATVAADAAAAKTAAEGAATPDDLPPDISADVAAIKAQTDLLPADPAGVSDLPADVSTSVAAIKAQTDKIPASPAAVGSAMTLESAERTSVASAVATHIETAGSLSMDQMAMVLQTLLYGTKSGAAANGGTITMVHPSVSGFTLTITPDRFGNMTEAGTLVTP